MTQRRKDNLLRARQLMAEFGMKESTTAGVIDRALSITSKKLQRMKDEREETDK